ncbi:Flp pilus assembly complex ATPase component TadA [Candidatus Micrarchaeota archaeon]|nr:Flp pilus assembly complex ATPase component TadA [Candidatus Micrarchaeota archaeon]
MVGESVVKSEGGKRRLVINYKGSPYGADIAQYPQVMKDVVERLQIADVNEVVLSEYYERIYGEEQTRYLKQIADLISRLESDAVWSPSHLGLSTQTKTIAPRHDAVINVLNNLRSDPFKAYLSLLSEVKAATAQFSALSGEDAEDLQVYLKTLEFMRSEVEKLDLVKAMRQYVTQLGRLPADRGIYQSFFEVSIKPSFIGSRIFFTGTENLELVDQYSVLGSKVYIYKHPDKVECLYFINPPEYTLSPEKYFLLEKTKEVVAGHRPTGEGASFFDIGQARQYFHKIYVATISDLAAKNKISLTVEEKEELAAIVSRYTIGYGVMEVLLSDRQLTDVYVDAPLGVKPIYLVHGKYGQCQTNIVFSDEEARSLVSRFRALSGRPFDEAHPILDFDLEDLQTRIAVIGKPLSLDGIAFAFRLHKEQPWTLPQFLDAKMMTPTAAGLFSFFVDAQASMLIVGSRGSGKTSLLQSLMQEIPQNLRLIVQEDTQELPIPALKRLGFNIQRMKTRPPLGKQSEAEVSAEDALRTALRLGDSVLIVGEVRSSIRGDQEVLVIENGMTKRIPIRELEGKNVETFKVPTLGFDLRCKVSALSGFVKHPERSKLVEITTKTGRKVTVTHDHSLFTSTRDFKVAAIECKDLREGDQLVIPSTIPCGFNDVEFINVFDMLPEFRVQNFEEPMRRAIAKTGWREATRVAEVKTGDIYNYYRTNQKSYPTLAQFSSVMQLAGEKIDFGHLQVRRGSSNPIPAIIPVDEDFCKFLGYYVSEGYYRREKKGGGPVVLTNSNEVLLADMKGMSRFVFDVEPLEREVHGAGTSTQVQINSAPLIALVERLGGGRICTQKRVPPLIFGLSKPKIAAFLRALYSGDGNITTSLRSGNAISYFTTSQKLAEDVAYLLMVFGIVARINSRQPKVGNRLWVVEFKDRQMVERFMSEIGFVQKNKPLVKMAWAHTRSSTVYFEKDALRKHLTKYPREHRHLFRSLRCSKNYLKRVANDPRCEVSDELKLFANGEFYLDEIIGVKEIELEAPEPVYDLSVSPSQNFIGGFGGILLHNTEAKALYEAMRVGAVGNVVMGTIHGESAYSIWDRVVNDLGVPTTSFKATDFAIVGAPIRFKGSLKRNRRIIEVTEVKKHWEKDPGAENGFLQWMQFDAEKDALEFLDDNLRQSEWVQRVRKIRGLTIEEILGEVNARSAAKQFLVDAAREHSVPNFLEATYTIRAHNKYLLFEERQREEFGSVDFKELMESYRQWVSSTLLREAIAQKSSG